MSRENFLYWKELVGLEDTDFPQLISLSETNIGRANIVPTRLMEIKNAIASNSLVNIQVQPGWGATTLFRYLKRELKKDSRPTLLVSFDFEKDKLDGSLTEAEFAFRTKWRMASGIYQMIRHNSMSPFYMFYMYDVFSFEDNGVSTWSRHLKEKENALENCEQDAEKFYEEFPFFNKFSADECVNYFLNNFQIRTVFLYLFPRRVDEDALLEFVGLIKNTYDGREIQPAAMWEVYIGVPKVFKQMQSVYARPSFDIAYERYSAGEMFSMLVSVYRSDDPAVASVSDVVDEEFITKVYDEKSTMEKIMNKVAQAMENSLEGNTADIPYKLTYTSKRG